MGNIARNTIDRNAAAEPYSARASIDAYCGYTAMSTHMRLRSRWNCVAVFTLCVCARMFDGLVYWIVFFFKQFWTLSIILRYGGYQMCCFFFSFQKLFKIAHFTQIHTYQNTWNLHPLSSLAFRVHSRWALPRRAPIYRHRARAASLRALARNLICNKAIIKCSHTMAVRVISHDVLARPSAHAHHTHKHSHRFDWWYFFPPFLVHSEMYIVLWDCVFFSCMIIIIYTHTAPVHNHQVTTCV